MEEDGDGREGWSWKEVEKEWDAAKAKTRER